MDAATGKERWRFAVASESTPLVVDGTLYLGSWDGRLYALDARDREAEVGVRGRRGAEQRPRLRRRRHLHRL